MPAIARHLHAVGTRRLVGPGCRTGGCPFRPIGSRGYCTTCDAVYLAAVALRDRLLEHRSARLHAACPDLFDDLAPLERERLLVHAAARGADRGQPPTVLFEAVLEDFHDEIRELQIEGLLT